MERLQFMVKNWMEFVDTEALKEQIGGREVYLWTEEQKEYLIPFLEKSGILIKGVWKEEKMLRADIYLVVALGYRDGNLLIKLHDQKMEENRDFTYICCNKKIASVDGYYKDLCGNEIICEGWLDNLNLVIQGYNNKIYIGKDFFCRDDVEIWLKGNARVRFGRNIYCKSGIMYFRNSESEFAGNSYLSGNFFISNFEGKMEIGEGFEALDSLYICVTEKTTLKVGKNCMTGKDVKILSGAAHSIFDRNLKTNINIKENVHVTLGEHVWLGMGSSVMYNTDMGDHSMLGADSLAKGIYPSHCILAGNIAKVVRENIDWDREDYISYEQFEREMVHK